MSRLDIERLLYDLVVVHGVAEFDSPEERERLIQDPPTTMDALIEAIFLADGRDLPSCSRKTVA